MRILVPIEVKIGRGLVNGKVQAIYPNFNKIDKVIRKGLDWSYYFDVEGIGWHYDMTDKLGEGVDPNLQFGVTCIPKDFALASVLLFPTNVSILTEVQFEDFYDNKSHINDQINIIDIDAIQSIKIKRDLGKKEDKDDKDALDPDNDRPGIRKNYNKTWSLKKTKEDIVIE